jgi:hypothetical protein
MELQYIGYIAEAIGTIAAYFAAYKVYKKNSQYIGNKLMALSIGFIGTYIGSILVYDLIRQALIIQIFYRIGISSLLLGTILLYFSMEVLVHSSVWLKKKVLIISLLVFWIIYTIFICVSDIITIIDISVANTQMDMIPLLILAVSLLFLLITSILDLYLHGFRKAEGSHKKNMLLFLVGLLVALGGLFISVGSSLTEDENIGFIMDILFFSILAFSQVLIARGFYRKTEIQK